MSLAAFTASTLALAFVAGVFGALLGLGGGVVLVPALTLVLGLDIRYAIAASLVSVVASSCGSALTFAKLNLTNVRLALVLQPGAVAGALVGAHLAGIVNDRVLYLLFGLVLAGSAIAMAVRLSERTPPPPIADALADALRLHGEDYRVQRTWTGIALLSVAGALSGLLGIGAGALKVPAMDVAMRLPIKVSSGTSSFMIGVTAVAGVLVFWARGEIDPFVSGPAAVGVALGALVGGRLVAALSGRAVRFVFIATLCALAAQMLWRAA